MAKYDDQLGWWALALAITQDLSAAQALGAMQGRVGVEALTWQELVRRTLEAERTRQERRRRQARTARARAYQREYKRRRRAAGASGCVHRSIYVYKAGEAAPAAAKTGE